MRHILLGHRRTTISGNSKSLRERLAAVEADQTTLRPYEDHPVEQGSISYNT
jgi:hypothetical protein